MSKETYQADYNTTSGYNDSGSGLAVSMIPTELYERYLSIFEGTEYFSEFRAAYDQLLSAYYNRNEVHPYSEKKQASYYQPYVDTFTTTVGKLLQSMRERDQQSLANQLADQRENGLNPVLTGVDTSAAATAGAGVAEFPSPDPASLPKVTTTGEVVLDAVSVAASVVATVASVGVGVASLVANVGRIAAQNLLDANQAEAIKQGMSVNARMIAEQYVLDNAPKADESSGLFPSWSIDSIPGVSDDYQSVAVEYAKNYYGTDRHRAGQLSQLSAMEAERYQLAKLYGSGFYSTNLEDMSSYVARMSKIQLAAIESDYNLQVKYNNLYSEYYTRLSPEVLAEAQMKVLEYQISYHDSLDGDLAAKVVNAANQSQADFFASYDSSAAADAMDSQNRYNSQLYDALDPEGKAAYDNYVFEVSKLGLELKYSELKAQDAIYDSVAEGLNSDNPTVRIQAAKALQRLKAKSAARSSQTGWQRFSNGAKTIAGIGSVGIGAAAAAMGMPVVGAGIAGAGAASMPSYPSAVPSSFDLDYGNIIGY